MKKVLLFLCLLISMNSFSQEKYVATIDLSDYGRTGYEVKTYERKGNQYMKVYKQDTSYLYILEDNDSFLTLIKTTHRYQSAFVVFINKKDNTTLEYYLSYDEDLKKNDLDLNSKGSVVRVQ